MASTAVARTMPDRPGDLPGSAPTKPGDTWGAGDAAGGSAAAQVRAPLGAGAMATTTGLPFSSVAYSTSSQPRTVTIDDLNADSYPDLIVPCNGANVTQIFYGTASGVYGQFPDYDLVGDFNSQKAVVADFDSDGRKDIAVVSYYNGVRVWYQIAPGFFSQGTPLSVGGNYSRCLVTGDLNGDPYPDLAIVSEQQFGYPYLGGVTLYMGQSTGGFAPGGFYSTGGEVADWIAMADLNEDGLNDLVVTNDYPSNTVAVLHNTGFASPRLSSPTQYQVGPGPNTCVVADLNADGHADVATANWSDFSSYSVLLGTGTGSLQPAMTTYPPSLQEGDPFAIAAGELTGDSDTDLVIAEGVMGIVQVLEGNGDGTFGSGKLYGCGPSARGIALGDVNQDGRTDIAVSNLNSNTVQVLTANASGGLPGEAFPIGSDTPSTFDPNDRLVGTLATGDINRDGHLDLVTTHAAAGTVSIVYGAGDGTFGPPSTEATGSTPQAVIVADLDQDGNPDLATANGGSGTVSVILGRGDGTFKGKSGYGVGKGSRHVIARDVNGDGRLDLVTADYDDNTVSVLLKSAGGAGFKSRMKFAAGSGPAWVSAGDLNGDGTMDLVVANQLSGGFTVLYGTGDKTLFGAPAFTSTGGGPLSVAVADLDQNGTPEIVLSITGFNNVGVWQRSGFGTYFLSGSFPASFEPREVAVGDLDQDGYPEILAAARVGHSFTMYYASLPPGGFSRWAYGSPGVSLVMADVNEDGRPDLLTLNSRCQAVSVLLNEQGGPSVAAARRAPESTGGAFGKVSLYPNPLNPEATLRFAVRAAGPLHVKLFDVQGRLVRTIVDEPFAAVGERTVRISGRGQDGGGLASGVYFYRIESQAGTATGRFAVLK